MSDSDNKQAPADQAAQGTTNPGEATPAKSPVELAQEDAAKWKNEYLYLRAEFENYKRNALKERSDLLKFGSERVVRDLLEVVDNFERALQVNLTPETMQTFKVGVEMIAKEIKEVFSKHGIQEVPSEKLAFNPLHHEAISSEPTAAVPEGHVARVFKKPYKLHDKIIRMGQVVVATTPPKGQA